MTDLRNLDDIELGERRAQLWEYAGTCEAKAQEGVEDGSPVSARDWYEAAGAAYRAAHEVERILRERSIFRSESYERDRRARLGG